MEEKLQKFGALTEKPVPALIPSMQGKSGSTPHDAPCPPPSTDDIANDHAINEWALNHLPLSEEQKKWMIQALMIDQAKKPKRVQTQYVKLRRQTPRKLDSTTARTGVKELTKTA